MALVDTIGWLLTESKDVAIFNKSALLNLHQDIFAEVFAKVLGWTAWLTVSFFNDILDCISADLKLQMKRSDGAAMQVRQSQGENYFS